MKSTILIAMGAALAIAGCDAQSDATIEHSALRGDKAALRAVSRLDCPDSEGDLERDLMSPDGRSCSYRGRNGSEVELTLVNLDGRPAAAVLGPMETTLQGLVPAPDSRREPGDTGILLGVGGNAKQTEVRLPGLSIDADGDRASVRMPGLRIEADGDRAKVHVSSGDDGTVVVNADDGGAEIRTRKDSALNLRTSYILAREDRAPSGWRAVGYEARGPVAGPIVVATIRARSGEDDAFDEAEDLLDRNVGR